MEISYMQLKNLYKGMFGIENIVERKNIYWKKTIKIMITSWICKIIKILNIKKNKNKNLKIKNCTCNLTCLKIPTPKPLMVRDISKMGAQDYRGRPLLWIIWGFDEL